jgi:hypothetical protein
MAHKGSKVFGRRFFYQNMRDTTEICKYTIKIFLLMMIFLNISVAFGASAGFAEGKGMNLYYKLADGVVKLVLVFKGAFEVIQACINGDIQAAKKNLMGYLLAYAGVYLLPTAFDEIQNMFGR